MGITLAAAAAVLASLAIVPAARAADWVGLGDSYAAGPLIPNQSLSPLGCLHSDHNFAHLAAARRGLSLADVSCSGATTADMTAAQSTDVGSNPPQFDALSAATKVVSLQIGGNDVISARIKAAAPKVAAVLAGIRSRSPGARVLVVDYAAILPESGSGCWPQVPLAWADVPYLRAKEKELNAMLATQAGAAGATFVDDYTASIGRDACKSSSVRWVEPLVPVNAAAPFHPNARGEAGVATSVVAALS